MKHIDRAVSCETHERESRTRPRPASRRQQAVYWDATSLKVLPEIFRAAEKGDFYFSVRAERFGQFEHQHLAAAGPEIGQDVKNSHRRCHLPSRFGRTGCGKKTSSLCRNSSTKPSGMAAQLPSPTWSSSWVA